MRYSTLIQPAASLMLGFLFTGLTASAADAKKLPEGKSVLTPGIEGHRLHVGPDNKFGEFTIIDVKDQPFRKAIRARVKEKPAEVWHVQISTLLAEPVKQGDVVLASFYVRKIESKNAGGEGAFSVYLGTPDSNMDPTITQEISAGAQWKKVQIPAEAASNCEPTKAMLNLDLGTEPQLLEIAEIKLVNYGRKAGVNDLPKSGY